MFVDVNDTCWWIFRSSLYYWAHYDFFNNTHLGEPIPNTICDEIFTSWRAQKGSLRSPLNTLVYKQTSATQDVHCLYRFVTDKRLFARIILTVQAINFKVRQLSFHNLYVLLHAGVRQLSSHSLSFDFDKFSHIFHFPVGIGCCVQCFRTVYMNMITASLLDKKYVFGK